MNYSWPTLELLLLRRCMFIFSSLEPLKIVSYFKLFVACSGGGGSTMTNLLLFFIFWLRLLINKTKKREKSAAKEEALDGFVCIFNAYKFKVSLKVSACPLQFCVVWVLKFLFFCLKFLPFLLRMLSFFLLCLAFFCCVCILCSLLFPNSYHWVEN